VRSLRTFMPVVLVERLFVECFGGSETTGGILQPLLVPRASRSKPHPAHLHAAGTRALSRYAVTTSRLTSDLPKHGAGLASRCHSLQAITTAPLTVLTSTPRNLHQHRASPAQGCDSVWWSSHRLRGVFRWRPPSRYCHPPPGSHRPSSRHCRRASGSAAESQPSSARPAWRSTPRRTRQAWSRRASTRHRS
jgi:hypothetical protein